MIVTTTPSVEGKEIIEYKGIVFGEVITGVNFLKDIGAGLRDIFGGRSSGYEGELIQAREEAVEEMVQRAREMGCDAIVGAKMDYEVLGSAGSMLMVTVSGTGVRLR
ncbi:MAG: putative heavy metal-binding protein [Tissierellia bacterium]|nr:putative heavy metal-binding protein [Tissierellia bacterium]